MTTKKLLARQARWAEFLAQYYFKLIYREGKANARVDALSRMERDVKAQDKAIRKQRTQVLLPRDKIDPQIVKDLQLAPLEEETPIKAKLPSDPEDRTGYDSIQLTDRILQENRISLELNSLREKA